MRLYSLLAGVGQSRLPCSPFAILGLRSVGIQDKNLDKMSKYPIQAWVTFVMDCHLPDDMRICTRVRRTSILYLLFVPIVSVERGIFT